MDTRSIGTQGIDAGGIGAGGIDAGGIDAGGIDARRRRAIIHAGVFAALANPTRHELMHHLCDGPRTPSELARLLDVSRPNVSQHLAVLQREGIVRRTYEEGRVLWAVVDPRLAEACALIDEIIGHELALRARALDQER